MLSQLSSSTVKIPNGTVSYLKIGSGTPLILMNGFTDSFRDWDHEFIDELAKNFQLFILNFRGVGNSVAHTEDHSIQVYAEDVIQFCEALALDRFGILGHSMGGYVAQELAMLVPERILFLILSSTRMGGKFRTMAPQWVIDTLIREYQSAEERDAATLSILCPPEAIDELRSKFQSQSGSQFSDTLVPNSTARGQNQARTLWLENFGNKHETYKTFPFPTLILSGNEDVIIPPENGLHLANYIPNSWWIRFPKAGHALIYQYPLKVSKAISNFVFR